MINKSLLLISLEQGAHRYLAFLILVISSILIIFNLLFLRSSIYFEFAITLLCISTVYLVFEKKLTENSTIIVPKMQLINIKVINISFFVFIIISNCLFYFNLYRPQIYFIAIVLCCVLIAFDILYTKSYIYSIWVLFKIFIIAFILRAHLLYEYPGFYGVDPWEHALWIRLLQEYGHVSLVSGLNLGYPPLFHIEVLISFLFTGLDLKNSFFFSIGFVYCIVIFFIFLFARNLTGLKISLLSSLFIAINQFHIAWGAWLIPTSIGVLILSTILYLVHMKLSILTEEIIIIVIFTVMLTYLHTLSPIVILVAIFVYLITSKIYSKLFNDNSTSKINYKLGFFLVTILGISTASRFIYNQYAGSGTFLESTLSPFLYTVSTDNIYFNSGEIATFSASDFPLNRISFYLIIAFALFGVLYWLRPRIQSSEKIGLIFTVITLIFFSYGPALFQIGNFIPERWIVFGMIIAAPIWATGIYYICCIPHENNNKIIMFILIIVIFSFFSINNNSVNLRTPFYGEMSKDPFRYSLTDSEIKAANTLLKFTGGTENIITDSYYDRGFKYYRIEKFKRDFSEKKSPIFNEIIEVERGYLVNQKIQFENLDMTIKRDLIYNDGYVFASIRSNGGLL